MKIKIMALFVLICLVVCTACSQKNNDKPSGENSEAINESDVEYDINHEYLVNISDDMVISAEYPVFDDDSINAMVCDYIDEYIDSLLALDIKLSNSNKNINTNQVYYEKYLVDIECEISYITPEFVSVVFSGIYNDKNAAHPTNLFFTLNIDLNTMDRVYLKDIYTVEANFYEVFANCAKTSIIDNAGGKWPNNWGDFSESICNSTAFLEGIVNEDEFYSYYTDIGVGIVYPVPFALGDYMTVVIPYASLEEFK